MSNVPDIYPLGDRILVERVEKKVESAGGVIIPDKAQKASLRAVVLRLGKGDKLDSGERTEFDVKVGDEILVAPYGFGDITGGDVDVRGKRFCILEGRSVIAITREKEDE